MPERPPVGESRSNGIIERAVGLVAGQARTLEAALEHRIGARVPPDARMLCWLVEFAAYLTNRCDIGSDGKTPLQILHGRRDNTPILELGERILCMPAKPARGGKWEPRLPQDPGEVLMENKDPPSQGRLRAGSQRGCFPGAVSESWPGKTASSQRSMPEEDRRPVQGRLGWIRTTGCG